MSYIEPELYKAVINNVINVCVDVVLKHKGRFLLIKRLEEPCKWVFWPIGGRIYKGETAEEAAIRKIKQEIGIDYTDKLKPVGFYEDTYTENSFSNNTTYSTISIVYIGDIHDINNIELDHTSGDWGLFTELPDRFNIKGFRTYYE